MRRLQWATAYMLLGLLLVVGAGWKYYIGGSVRDFYPGVFFLVVGVVWHRIEIRRGLPRT